MKDLKPIALDWDGVLIDHPPNITFEEMLTYPPMKDAVKIVNYLVQSGYEMYVCTARLSKEHKYIRKWLRTHGFPKMRVTNKKLQGTKVYIDDRAIRFEGNWDTIAKYFV